MSPALTVMRPQAAGHHAHPYLTSRSNQQLEALETSEIAEAAIRGTVASSSSTALKGETNTITHSQLPDIYLNRRQFYLVSSRQIRKLHLAVGSWICLCIEVLIHDGALRSIVTERRIHETLVRGRS